MWFRVGRAGTCSSFAMHDSFRLQGQEQSLTTSSCDRVPREEKCSMVETCTKVQGIWAFVEQVWIPACLLSISDKQQSIIK